MCGWRNTYTYRYGHGHGYGECNSYGYGECNSYGNSHSYRYSHSHGYGYVNIQALTHGQASPDPETSSDAAAATVGDLEIVL